MATSYRTNIFFLGDGITCNRGESWSKS